MQKDVVGFEHRVGFELAAPVAIGMLLRNEVIARANNGSINFRQIRIDTPELRNCG